MRVWIIAPEIPPEEHHGSAPLVERLLDGLDEAGVTALAHRARPGPNVPPRGAPPDVVHVIGVTPSAASYRHLEGASPEAPLVLTLAFPTLEDDLARPDVLAEARLLVQRAAAITVESDWARDLTERVFPEAAARISVIEPRAYLPHVRGDAQVATVRLKDVPEDATIALVLSAPGARLDPIPLIEAASTLKAEGSPLHLVLAGRPLDASLDVMLTASSSLYRYVHRIQRIPRGGIGTLLERADLVLCPSQGDAFPQALLEAMAARRAIVARQRPPTTDLVRDGHEALLYRDTEGLLAALRRLHDDPEARAALGERAAKRYAEGGSPADEVARYHALYSTTSDPKPRSLP